MDATFTKAAQAYQNKPTPEKALTGDKSANPTQKFSDMVADAAHTAVENIAGGEKATMQAAKGEADLTDVVTAVTQAEITLQTVMSIRDTLVDSYKRVMQMPI